MTQAHAAAPGIERVIAPTPRAALLERGFELRCVASGSKLTEMVDQYRQLGFEVELVPHRVDPGACGVCRICFDHEETASQDVYVRRATPPIT